VVLASRNRGKLREIVPLLAVNHVVQVSALGVPESLVERVTGAISIAIDFGRHRVTFVTQPTRQQA